jgi:hypothetical protein
MTLQMGLETSCNNIKDVLSLSTVCPHQTWVTCMCKYHKNISPNGTENLCPVPFVMLFLWYLHIQVTHVWWGETVGSETTSLMLLQLVSSPICNVIFVIFTHTSDPRCNNIKDVLSLPTVCPHQTWVTFMCKYHKHISTNGTGHKL